jgi:hypothetical protein
MVERRRSQPGGRKKIQELVVNGFNTGPGTQDRDRAFTLLAMPEPASLALLCTGLAGVGALRRPKPGLKMAQRIGFSRLLGFAAPRVANVFAFKASHRVIWLAPYFESGGGNYDKRYLKVEQGVL